MRTAYRHLERSESRSALSRIELAADVKQRGAGGAPLQLERRSGHEAAVGRIDLAGAGIDAKRPRGAERAGQKGRVLRLDVLDYRETHGWEIRNERWRAQFHGKTAADPIEVSRDIANISVDRG